MAVRLPKCVLPVDHVTSTTMDPDMSNRHSQGRNRSGTPQDRTCFSITPCCPHGSRYQDNYEKLPARSQPPYRCQAVQHSVALASASFSEYRSTSPPHGLAPLIDMPDKPILRHTGRIEEPDNLRTLRNAGGVFLLSRIRGQRST